MSELRKDIISGDWVIIAGERAFRPHSTKERAKRIPPPRSACPFELVNMKKAGVWPPIAAFPSPDAARWQVAVIPNKYPALAGGGEKCSELFRHGMNEAKTGVGSHHLIITRDHKKNFKDIDLRTAVLVFKTFQEQYRAALKDGCSEYMVPYFNWGPAAGASVYHPHYQTLSLPAIPAHVLRSLAGAKHYFGKHRRCLRCAIIKEEKRLRERVVAENTHAIAIAPYASKVPFEVIVLPKRHSAYFRTEDEAVLRDVAALLRTVMTQIKKVLADPDLNFFVHDAPLTGGRYPYHHWHAQIFPKISIPAGFEYSTEMYINIVSPENAAARLRP